MPTLQDNKNVDEKNRVWAEMAEIIERTGGAPTGEDGEKYDRLEARYDELDKALDRAARHEKAEAARNAIERPAGLVPGQRDGAKDEADDRYAKAFAAYITSPGGTADMDPEDREVLRAGFVAGDQFKNAAGVATGAAGGFTVPPAFREKIVQTMLAWGPMLSLAEPLETDTGVNIPWATNDDTANEGAILAENTQISEQDVTLGQSSLDAFVYTSKLVRVSWQLMQDNPNFDSWLAGRLGERLARIYNRHATVGTGTAQPDGLFNPAATITGTGSFATTGGISYANLVDLVESVDEAYLSSLSDARFMMHQTMRKAIRKLLDTQNRPIWEPSVQAGTPDSLLGYGVSINNHCATLATSSKSLGFGSVREAYVWRTVRSNELVTLKERYADFLQTGFFLFGRADGTLQNSAAFKIFATTATA